MEITQATGIFYQQDILCPVCQQKFPQVKLRKSACPVEGRDSDFFVRYSGIDANWYSVWVCSCCGYAATDASFAEIKANEAALIKAALTGHPAPKLDGQRDFEAAAKAFKQALFCNQARKAKASAMAGLYLRMAWLFRGQNDPATERAYLDQALGSYTEAYQREPTPIGKMSALTLTYLIGELSRRIGNYKEAVQYFSIVVSDKSGTDQNIVNLARDQWHQARDEASGSSQPAPTVNVTPAELPPVGPVETAASAPAAQPTTPQLAVAVQTQVRGPDLKKASRQPLTMAATIYPEHWQWLRKSAAAAGIALDPWAVLRALMDLACQIDPSSVQGSSEEELSQTLEKLIKERG